MTIQKFDRAYVPICDLCGEALCTRDHVHAFDQAVAATRQAGWKARRSEDGWEDICTECQEDDQP